MQKASIASGVHRMEHFFHLILAALFLLVAAAGFFRTYLLPVMQGSFAGAGILHVHGALMFAWCGLYLAQTALVASGHTLRHRDWGLAGIALFSVLMCSTIALIIHAARADLARAGGDFSALQFPAASVVNIALACGLFTWAIASRNRPGVHKRAMVLLMIVLLQAAVARLFVMPFLDGPPTVLVTIPVALVTDTLILVAMVLDRIARRHIHPAYIWGGLGVLAVQMLIVPVARSDLAIDLTAALIRTTG